MTWEEYKAQRRKEEKNAQTASTNSNSSSSWEEYKEQRRREKQEESRQLQTQQTENEFDNYLENYRANIENRMQTQTNNKTSNIPIEAVMDSDGNIYDVKELNAEKARRLGETKRGSAQYVNGELTNFQEGKTTSSNGQEEQKNFAKNILKKGSENLKNDIGIIGSNLKDSAYSGTLQFGKTVGMSTDNAYNTQVDMRRILRENMINERRKRGLSTEELEEDLENNPIYQKSDVKPFYQEKIDKVNQRMAENTEQASNPVSKKVAELSQSMGNNIAGMAITAINPALGFAYFTGSATGSYYDEAIQKGMNDNDARNYATIMGLMEGTTEKYLSAQNIKGAKAILEGTGIKNALKSFGLEVGENFVQEAVMPAISELTTKAIAGDEYLKYDYNTAEGWKTLGMDSLSDGIDGALSAILLNGATKGVASCINITNKMKNGNKVSEQEIKVALTDAQKSGVDAEKILKDKIQESAIKKIITTKNETPELAQNVQNSTEQQMKNYIYEKSNNAKIDNLRKDASKYFNNSEKAHNYMQMLEKIIEDKNIDIRFNADLKTPDGKIANGSYSNGVITINPNSTRVDEFIAVHELTHAIGTDSMKNIIETYRNSNPEFNTAVEKLLQNYNSTEITEEALSDVSAQLFGNQEFINNVAQTNPNIFQKIYSEIKYLWHQFRGYKNQNQFIEDLYYKWTQAYNSNNKLNNSENYLITQNNKGKYVKADRQVITGNNPLEWETQVENYINDNIRQGKDVQVTTENGDILTITKDTSGKAKFRNQITDKYGNTRYLNNKEFLSKLTAETHIDELAQISQKINKNPIPDYKKHKFAKDGFDYRSAYFEDFDGQYYKITMSVGKNGDIDTIYNIGKMDKKNRSKSSLVAQRPSDKNITSNEELTSTNSIPSSNKDVNTTTKYSIQESKNNTESSYMQDNQGRTLSKEQQEYFRDSKVRDENGNLLTVYHGSNSEFTVFDAKKSGQASKESKVGFWFTETKEGAENFANSLWYGDKKATSYETYLNIKNPKVYNSIDNSIELENIDNRIKEQKNIIRKLENKNIAIEINKQELKWATSKEELQDIARIEGIDFEDAERYNDALKEYNKLEKEYDNKKYGDSYEQFRTDIYKIANKSASDANFGGTGMWLENENEIISKFKQQLIDEGYDGIIIKNTKYDSDTMGRNNNQYVAFYPEQIKNVDNTNPTDNPDIRYSQNNETWQSYLDKNFKPTGTRTNMQDILVSKATNEGAFTQQAKNDTQNNQKVAPSTQNNVLETGKWTKEQQEKAEQKKVAEILTQPIEKVKEKNRAWAIAKANIIDKGIVFEELSQKTKNRELQGKWDYTLTATARGQNAIGQARYEMDPKTKTEKQISKSLEDIRTEVGNKTSDFQQYMYHQLNIDRMTLEDRFAGETGINYERKNAIKNKPVFGKSITADISKKIVAQYEKNNPEFKKWAQDVYDFNNANKQELVKNGVISQELADKLNEMYPHYVPIKRIDAKGNAIKVPLDTNRTGINSPLAKATGGNKDIQPLFETMADRTLQTYRASARNGFGVELMKTLNSIQDTQQTDIDTILEEIGDIDSNAELLQEGKNGNNPTFTVFNNGEKVTFEITKDMFDALKPQSDLIRNINNSKLSKVANKVSNFRRGVLTEYNPLFSLTNAIKDAQDVLINSQHPGKTYAKFPEAYAQIIKNGYWYKEYVRNGGEQNSYFKDGKFETDIKTNKAKSAITLPLKGISKINNVIEMAPRLAEYIVSREAGSSIETSMLDASRVTTNFKAGGDITKTLNRNGFTFLNASVQGFQQQVRNIQEANVKGLKGYAVLATKYAIAGLPALILNNFVWDDDEDYWELQDYVKDNYYIIGKYGDGKFVRIPKGRTVAVIQKIVNNASEYINENKEINIDSLAKDFWGDLKFASDNLAPNNPLDNNIISPIIQIITNTSWYGEDIVPKRLQDKPKSEQYDETTDSLSIWLGEKLNVSPYKINYLLDQYGGGISDVVLPTMTKQAEDNVFKDKFTTDSVMKNKYPGEFYSKLDELTVKGNSYKATDEDLLKSKYASDISKDMGDLYKEKREIQNSDLPDSDKKEKIKDIQKEINKIAKDGLANIENLKIDRNTTKIGNNQYYKLTNTKDGTQDWKKLSEEEIRKNKNISLTTYADYKEKVAKETIKQRKNGTISEDGSIKDKDKITILLNSACSREEKTALYEQYILSATDKKYSIVKTTNIDITQYLQYKLADANGNFDSDKKDDGTVTGKSVSGSAKQKRWQYIENMNITYTQKLILYGLECTPNDSQQRQIINYVKSLPNKTNKEKLEILSQFKGFTIYKDGRVKY